MATLVDRLVEVFGDAVAKLLLLLLGGASTI
jgi:hypothetical protein